MFCTHSSRFAKAGDYYAFNLAGINFFVIKSKIDGQLKAFHNVCRHRAYLLLEKIKVLVLYWDANTTDGATIPMGS